MEDGEVAEPPRKKQRVAESPPPQDNHREDGEIVASDSAPLVAGLTSDAGFATIQWTVEGPPRPCLETHSQEFSGNTGATSQYAPTINFLKTVKWSPDGVCLLTNSEDNAIRLYELPAAFLQTFSHSTASTTSSNESSVQTLPRPALRIQHGEAVYDLCWYPYRDATQHPEYCCFATTSKDHPVQLWDAFTGALRATYRSYNHVDELVSPLSICFTPSGDKIYCGFDKCIRIFDIARPGREFKEIHTFDKQAGGLKGLISTISFSPDNSGYFAAGTYNNAIGVYTAHERRGAELMWLLGGRGGAAADVGHTGGVTQVQFSPDGRYLFSGARKDNFIRCWDIRNTGNVLATFERDAMTNQRISFDIDSSGTYLVTGSKDGRVLLYNLLQGSLVAQWQVSRDAVNSVAFHPTTLPLLATGTGMRKFELDNTDEHDADAASMETSEASASTASYNSVIVWQFPYRWVEVPLPTSQPREESSDSMVPTPHVEPITVTTAPTAESEQSGQQIETPPQIVPISESDSFKQ